MSFKIRLFLLFFLQNHNFSHVLLSSFHQQRTDLYLTLPYLQKDSQSKWRRMVFIDFKDGHTYFFYTLHWLWSSQYWYLLASGSYPWLLASLFIQKNPIRFGVIVLNTWFEIILPLDACLTLYYMYQIVNIIYDYQTSNMIS